MPVCDIFILAGALEPEVEEVLVKKVSDLLVLHEMRRVSDLMEKEEDVQAMEKASSIAWMFVHRTEVYVAGRRPDLPYYRFEITIPQGTIDDRFPAAIDREIYAAVKEAEGGRRPHLSQRLWTHIHEMPDGLWGAGDRPLTLRSIIDFISPGMGDWAVKRFQEKTRGDAAKLVDLARTPEAVA